MDWLFEMLFSSLGMKGVAYVLVGGGLGYLVNAFLKGRGYQWDVLRRAIFEAGAVVYEVYQVYTSEILKGRADGKLTPEEKTIAKDLAMDKLKSNLGKAGLARLARVLGLKGDALDGWLGNKVEAAVLELKSARPQ